MVSDYFINPSLRRDESTAQYPLPIIEDGGLAGGDG